MGNIKRICNAYSVYEVSLFLTVKMCSTSDLVSFLFSIYLHDLNDFISQTDTEGLPTLSEMFEEFTDIFIYWGYCICCRKRTAITKLTFLNHFENYCKRWNLNFNTEKSKLLICTCSKKKDRLHKLLTQCHLDLFDTCKIVEPILLNVCEVWGFSNNAIIEREFPLKKK